MASSKEGNMRYVFFGLLLAGGVVYGMQTPAGRAMVFHVADVGRALTNNIVGNLTR